MKIKYIIKTTKHAIKYKPNNIIIVIKQYYNLTENVRTSDAVRSLR